MKRERIYDWTADIDEMGTVLIVDISGYTRFVREVDYLLGSWAITHLLRVLIEANQLGLSVSEIEGDAILFYRLGSPPSTSSLKQQFEAMMKGFCALTQQISESVPQASQLSIKMVAHYGRIIEFSLNGFRKLYGEAVIEAHRLLKNDVDSNTYLLITEKLLSSHDADACQEPNVGWMCATYDFGTICYKYLLYHHPVRADNRVIPVQPTYKIPQILHQSHQFFELGNQKAACA